jgi:hypothetical protein
LLSKNIKIRIYKTIIENGEREWQGGKKQGKGNQGGIKKKGRKDNKKEHRRQNKENNDERIKQGRNEEEKENKKEDKSL